MTGIGDKGPVNCNSKDTAVPAPVKCLELSFGCLYVLSEITSKSTSKERFEKKGSLGSQGQGWSELTGGTEERSGVSFTSRRKSRAIALSHMRITTHTAEGTGAENSAR